MIQLEWLQALLLILGLIASSVVVIASFIKTSREQRKQDNETWASAVEALKEHNSVLKARLADAEQVQIDQGKEVAVLEGKLLVLERERSAWTRRNMALYDRCMEYRAKLASLGHPQPEINGDT